MTIQGVYNNKNMAFFQLIPREEGMRLVTDVENFKALASELQALALGEDLMTRFHRRAKRYAVNLPGMSQIHIYMSTRQLTGNI